MDKPWLKHYDPHVSPDLQVPQTRVHDWIDKAADEFPERIAVFFFGAKIQFGPLRAMTNQFAHALAEIGLKKGDRIGLILPNMPQAVIAIYGAMKAGVTPFLFDPLLDEDALERQLKEAGVETLVVLDLLLRRIDPVFARTRAKTFIIAGVKDFLPFPRNFFFSLAAKGRGIHVRVAKKPNIFLFKDFLLKGRTDPFDSPAAPGDAAAVLFTKGTKGPGKGVILTHANLAANVVQISNWVNGFSRGRDVFFAMAPFHEAYGITTALNLPMYWASSSVHLPRFEPQQFLNAVKKQRPTVFPAEPSMIEAVAWNPELKKYGISSIRKCFSVGQVLPEDLVQNFEKKLDARVVEGYGVAEASPLTHAQPFTAPRKSGSIGLPLPGTDARIVDPQGGETDLPPGKTGEILVRGPQVMEGYWARPEETRKALRDGWLHTGDLGWMDEEGFFFFVSKMKS
ncbi:MAG TPA: AMP-binding protein [Thermodesulfobacteriota bacterium]|nr:AMP-binding protein [Thermodesulfobacteriota bacterium]